MNAWLKLLAAVIFAALMGALAWVLPIVLEWLQAQLGELGFNRLVYFFVGFCAGGVVIAWFERRHWEKVLGLPRGRLLELGRAAAKSSDDLFE